MRSIRRLRFSKIAKGWNRYHMDLPTRSAEKNFLVIGHLSYARNDVATNVCISNHEVRVRSHLILDRRRMLNKSAALFEAG